MPQRRSQRSRSGGRSSSRSRPSSRDRGGADASRGSGSRGGNSRGPSRGGAPSGGRRRPPPRRGGGGGGLGAGPIIASGIIFVLGIVALIFVMKDNKTEAPKTETMSSRPDGGPTQPTQNNRPKTPIEEHGPPPQLTKDVQMRAKSASQKMATMVKDVERLQKESVEAKDAGNDNLWQSKLTDAMGVHDQMKDLWNDIIMDMPADPKSTYWDKEQVANYWLKRDAIHLERAGKIMAGADKMRRR